MPPVPSDAEFRILLILWQNGPGTVREVHEQLARGTRYTATLKQMQVMHEKGFLDRNEDSRSHVYRAAMTKEEARARFAGDLMNRIFEGSARSLVLGALTANRASQEDIEEVRRMLDRLERKKNRQ